MSKYNLNSTEGIRSMLGKNHMFYSAYDKDKQSDQDWVNVTVFSLVREYEIIIWIELTVFTI
jgi:hypothetical protein